MQKCRICGDTDFYKEAGYFFCQTCQTQHEDIREEILDIRVDNTTRLRKIRVKRLRSTSSGEEVGWTTWELYNFVLIGLTNELLELGVPSDIKLTILQLWATYLGKVDVAFISTNRKCVPKLARQYRKRDAEVIYGKVQVQKRSRRRKRPMSGTSTSIVSGGRSEGSSMKELNRNKRLLVSADYNRYLQSQGSSDADGVSSTSQSRYSFDTDSVKSLGSVGRVKFSYHAKEEARKIKKLSKRVHRSQRTNYEAKYTTTEYRTSPYIITPMRLWAILYLALRIHDQPIQLGDMLRYGREGHLSYYKLDHLVPPEVTLTPKERNILMQNVEITHKGMRRNIANMAKFLGVHNMLRPNFSSLVSRYCQELGLPRGIQLYTERIVALSPPKMEFDVKKSYCPNYEGRAMAFIVVVLKTLLALDGMTEYQISRVAEKINSMAIDRGLLSEKLFSFQEWQRYIECRKIILVHAHYPTKMKYSPESVEVDDLYLKFIKFLNSKSNREEPEVKNTKGYLPEELAHALAKYVSSLNVQNVSPEAIDIFPPSLTPLHSYLQQLLDHPLYDIPMIVHKDFFLTKVGYMTKPNVLMELAKQCDIQLKIMDANLHFLEKHVPPFEQPRMPSVEKLNQKIEVQDDTSEILKDESGILNNYIDEKTPCTVKVDVTKKQWFEEVQSDVDNSKRENYAGEDFLFTETLPNGRLAIRTDIGVVEKEENSVPSDNGGMFSAILDRKFCDKYGIELSSKEKESISKLDKRKPNSLRKLARNSKGHFVKPNIAREKTNQDKSESTPENVNFVTNSQTSAASETCTRRESAMESDAFDLGSLDLNEADIKNGFCDLDNYFNLSDISFFAELDDAVPQTDCKKDLLYFFQPFKDYWIYDCIFSRVKSKNFAIFEKSLPRTFRWLLNECALTVEMTTMDLYQELCLIEAYYSQILIPGLSGDNKSKQVNEILKNKLNIILSKW